MKKNGKNNNSKDKNNQIKKTKKQNENDKLSLYLNACQNALTQWIENKKVDDNLLLVSYNGNYVAHWLAHISTIIQWSTHKKEILILINKDKCSVASLLASHNESWYTEDIDILQISDANGVTVEKVLQAKKKTTEKNMLFMLDHMDKVDASVDIILTKIIQNYWNDYNENFNDANYASRFNLIMTMGQATNEKELEKLFRYYNESFVYPIGDILKLVTEYPSKENFVMYKNLCRQIMTFLLNDPLAVGIIFYLSISFLGSISQKVEEYEN